MNAATASCNIPADPAPGDVNPHSGRPYSKRFFELLKKRRQLPCYEARGDVLRMVSSHRSSVLVGETGSGKTTQVPQFLLSIGSHTASSAIAVTQPRRVAAMSVAARVAQELDVELGQQVGYLIRFEDVTSDKTVLKYMTDGMLLREAMSDPLLNRYSVVVLDEAHERTLATDILFGLVKEALQKRPELRCLVMSATLETDKFKDYWCDAPLLKVPGRMFPVETFFALTPQKDYVEAAVDLCVQIHTQDGPGDILLFLCGEEEIETASAELETRCEGAVLVLRLYSGLPMQQQRKVFIPTTEGARKIIVATNIAETSLTIDGVVYVVDPGLFKQKLYNPRTHAESLLVSPISKASAMQRAGRAGRTQPGKCFRLYTPEAFDRELPESTYPEIIRSNLSSVVLTLKKLGIEDLVHFDFMEPPSPESMMRALEMLHFLGAVDDECELTGVGRQMAEYPVDPHLSRSLIAAAHYGCCSEMASILAMLSIPTPFSRPRHSQKWADKAHQAMASGSGDHLTLLGTYSCYSRAASKTEFCKENFLHERGMKQAESICKQLQGISRSLGLDAKDDSTASSHRLNGGNLTSSLRRSLAEGFFMQCAHIDQGGKHYLTVRDQQLVYIHPSSFLHHKPEWVLYHETVVTDRCYLRTVSAVTPEMLIEVAPRFYHPSHRRLSEQATKTLQRALPRVRKN